MIKKIKEKIKQGWDWTKKQWKKLLVILGIGVVLAAGNILTPDKIPSVVAEGQVIEFPYTDENSNEDLIIYTDKEIYTPLWAWNGFDVYVAVENKSGESQPISFQSFFSKDFSIEKVSLLNPIATTTIKEPIYKDICKEIITTSTTSTNTTSTFCYQEKIGEKDKVVLGVWIPTIQQQFSKENYDKTISDNKIKVKQKIGDKVRGNFIDYSLKGEFSYYKLRIKSNEPFSKEEFDLEIIGEKGGYGMLDPTIFTDDFNSYTDGDLNGQGSWAGNTGFDIQTATAGNPEGEGVGKEVIYINPASEVGINKTGTLQSEGKTTIYLKNSVNNTNIAIHFFEGANEKEVAGFIGSISGGWAGIYAGGGWTNIGTFTANIWSCIEVEWHSSPSHQVRARLDGGTWSDWAAPMIDWTTGVDKINMTVDPAGHGNFTGYFDYIAENPYVPPSAEVPPQMEVIIIGG